MPKPVTTFLIQLRPNALSSTLNISVAVFEAN